MAPMVLEARGERIAIVAFTDNEPDWAAKADASGTNFLEIEEASLEKVRDCIARGREFADLLIFSIHWGPNMRQKPTPEFQRFARAVIDSGADIFHGHSAHLFQGIEIYRGKPIIYDAGDFVDDYAVDSRLRNDQGFLFRLIVRDGKVLVLEMIPTVISNCSVNLARENEREAIMMKMIRLSEEFGTECTCSNGLLSIECGMDSVSGMKGKTLNARQ
jgi:poly-gamma-glutamate synthesis protein (capsule biosynthesis protein)